MNKVYLLCANYEPGGAQRACIRLKNELNQKGINAECLFMHRKSPDFTEKPLLLIDKKIDSLFDVLKLLQNLKKKIKEDRPKAIISFLPHANVLGQFIALCCGVKVRICSHRNLSEKELNLPLKLIDLLWAYFGVYTDITAVSRSTKNSFRYYGKRVFEKIKIIHNGISFVPTNLSKVECRRNLGINQDKFVLGNIGRLVEQKNHMLLIDILPKLSNIYLVIVGKGELKELLIYRAKELGVLSQITIIDDLNTDQIPIFLKTIDIFVMPSYFEGMSNALLEALCAGKPIISSDVESQRDVLFRDSDKLLSGILVSNSDKQLWINEIKKLRDNPKDIEILSTKALIRSKDFTISEMAKGFISVMNN